MSGNMRSNDSDSRGLRRKLRKERDRERSLTMQHRWYAGGIATLLAGALIFTGITPAAMADEVVPTPTPTSSETAAPPAEETPAVPPATDTPDPSPSASPSESPAVEPTEEPNVEPTTEPTEPTEQLDDTEGADSQTFSRSGGDFSTLALVRRRLRPGRRTWCGSLTHDERRRRAEAPPPRDELEACSPT